MLLQYLRKSHKNMRIYIILKQDVQIKQFILTLEKAPWYSKPLENPQDNLFLYMMKRLMEILFHLKPEDRQHLSSTITSVCFKK